MELLIDNIEKSYGKKRVCDGISLRLRPGVIGLLGANGAGKTTLMRMICGVLSPDSGKITLDGIDVSREAFRDALGYLPQSFGYYPSFTGREFLLYVSALKGLSKNEAERKTEELLALVNLSEVADKKIKTYSGGMKQRLGIAEALLNDPKLLVLDEPTSGLDPGERARFREMIAEKGKNAVVLFSTHIVSDIELIADRILLMKDGHIIWDGKKEEVPGDLESFYLSRFGGAESRTEGGLGL